MVLQSCRYFSVTGVKGARRYNRIRRMWHAIPMFAMAVTGLAQTRDAEFNKLADRFFDEALFRYDPVQGTAAGFHQYDARLSVMSRAEIDTLTGVLHRFEQEVDRFGGTGLSPLAAADRELLLSQIRGQL